LRNAVALCLLAAIGLTVSVTTRLWWRNNETGMSAGPRSMQVCAAAEDSSDEAVVSTCVTMDWGGWAQSGKAPQAAKLFFTAGTATFTLGLIAALGLAVVVVLALLGKLSEGKSKVVPVSALACFAFLVAACTAFATSPFTGVGPGFPIAVGSGLAGLAGAFLIVRGRAHLT
jgi:hypothetical protein